MRKSV
ncbi:hypothetical protein BDFB_007560 [Asbolus verrucosus]|jgi:hypothetical protein